MTTIPFNFGKEIKLTTSTDNNFTIKDTSSEIAKILPQKWIEPLVIIAKIKGYDSIDDYVLNLIKDRLEMFADTRDNLDHSFQIYMHNTMIGKDVPNEWATTTTTKDEDEEEEEPTRKGTPEDFVKKIHDDYYNNKKVNADDKEKEDLK